MKQKITFILSTILLVFALQTSHAQTVYLLNQNFDSIKVLHKDTLPHGWTTSYNVAPHSIGASPGWFVDTLRTNSAPLYYTGGYGTPPDTASGFDHVVIRNNLDSTGTYNLLAPSVSTIGKTGITVSWGSRTTASFTTGGSTTATLSFSVDNGSTWDTVAYTRVVADGAWHLTNNATPIALPTKAENKASLILKWTCNVINGASGTLRLDDIIVKGTIGGSGSGINNVYDNNAFEIYPNPAADKFIITSTLNNSNKVDIINMIGQRVKTIDNCTFPVTIERNHLNSGVYFIQICNQQNQVVANKKLIIE